MIAVSTSVPFCGLTANNIGLPGCTIYIATIRVNLFVDCFLLFFLPLSIAAFYRNRAHHVRPLLCMYIVFPFNLLFNLFSCSLNLSFVALIISLSSLLSSGSSVHPLFFLLILSSLSVLLLSFLLFLSYCYPHYFLLYLSSFPSNLSLFLSSFINGNSANQRFSKSFT